MTRETAHTCPTALRPVALAACLVLLGTSGCNLIFGIDDPPDETAGLLLYTTDTGGVVEVWAASELGGAPVRLTEGESDAEDISPWQPTASWDGAHIAFFSLRAANGSFDGNRHLWRMDPDGGNRTYLTQTNPGTAAYGLSWEGDNRHLVYSDDEPCSNNILRIDTQTPGSEVMLYDVESIAAEPTVSPIDRNHILFMDQVCGEVGTLRRLDLTGPEAHPIDGVVEQQGRFRYKRFSTDGSRFTYASSSSVYIHDFSAETVVYTHDDDASSFSAPTFGRDDARIFAKWCSGDNECDLVSIDPEAGTMEQLGVPDIRSDNRSCVHIGWARTTMEIDGDGDGIGNGVDSEQ